MKKLIQQIARVSTPLSISGLVITVLYGIYRSVVEQSDFSLLGKSETFILVDKIVSYLFVLALAALCLGITAYVLTKTNLFKRWRADRRKRSSEATDPYEYLEWEAVWEIKDPEGKRVEYTRNATVRFLQPNVSVITDRIWGDGETMHEYRCSLGRPADVFDYVNSKRVMISLRENKKRGAIERFTIARTILNGFAGTEEWIEEEPFYFVKEYTLRVIFPKERRCRRAVVTRREPYMTQEVGEKAFRRLKDGRWELRVTFKKLWREKVILRWWW